MQDTPKQSDNTSNWRIGPDWVVLIDQMETMMRSNEMHRHVTTAFVWRNQKTAVLNWYQMGADTWRIMIEAVPRCQNCRRGEAGKTRYTIECPVIRYTVVVVYFI